MYTSKKYSTTDKYVFLSSDLSKTSLAIRFQRHEACLEHKNSRSVSLKDWEKELQSEEVIIVDYLLLTHKKEYR